MLLLLLTACAVGQTKPIPIGVKVEAEGGGVGKGMWAQSARDLTPSETKRIESLVTAELKKQDGVEIVPLNYPQDYIGVVVVAAKLPNGNKGKWFYVASSVIIVATKQGTDELVTHDVIADADLVSLAHNIGFQIASARLRAATRLWK